MSCSLNAGIRQAPKSLPGNFNLEFCELIATAGSATKGLTRTDKGIEKLQGHQQGIQAGRLIRHKLKSLDEFAGVLCDMRLRKNSALVLGIPKKNRTEKAITTKRLEASTPGAMARTKDNFEQPKVGLVLFDYDAPNDGAPLLSADEVLEGIFTLLPELRGCAYLVTPSASSFIYDAATNERLRGSRGIHIYFVVEGSETLLKSAIQERRWLSEYGEVGRFELSRANKGTGVRSVLERGLIDIAVLDSPERLAYESGCVFGFNSGLTQRLPKPTIIQGAIAQLDKLAPLTAEQQKRSAANKQAARKAIEPERKVKLVKHIQKNEKVSDHEKAVELATERINNCDRGVLTADHVLYTPYGESILVKDLNAAHDGWLFCDPDEPTYREGAQTAKLFWNNGTGWRIHSFAKGGKNYRSLTAKAELDFAEELAARVKQSPERRKFAFLFGMESDGEKVDRTRYLRDLALPAPGNILAISSPTGSGKTRQLENLKREFFQAHPDGVFDVIGYRNTLGRQTAGKLGIDHILDRKDHGFSAVHSDLWLDDSQGMAYCIDSLMHRYHVLTEAAEEGRGTCLIFDEGDAVIKHLLTAKTVKKRDWLWKKFTELINLVLDNGGYIVSAEHNLTQVSVDLLSAIAPEKTKIEKVINKGEPRPDKEIHLHQPINKKGLPSDSAALFKLAAYQKVLQLANEGLRVAIVSDTQKFLQVLEEGLKAEGHRMRRVDSTTVGQQSELLINPVAVLSTESDHLGLSPTCESGFDIDGKLFDVGVALMVHTTGRKAFQMLERFRGNIDFHAFIKNQSVCAPKLTEDELNPEKVIKAYKALAVAKVRAAIETAEYADEEERKSAKSGAIAQLKHSFTESREAKLFHEFRALYEIRDRLSKASLRSDFVGLCRGSGFTIGELEACLPVDADERAALREGWDNSKQAVEEQEAALYLAADTSSMALWQAEQTMQNGSSDRMEMITAAKVIRAAKAPGLPLNNHDFVLKEIVQAKGRSLKRHKAFWIATNPEIASFLDNKKRATSEQGFITAHDQTGHSLMAKFIEQSGLGELLSLEEHGNTTPLKRQVHDYLVTHADIMNPLFGLNFKGGQTPNMTVNKVLKALGFCIKSVRREGSRGKQARFYSHQHTDVAVEVWEALKRLWEASEEFTGALYNPVAAYVLGDARDTVATILEEERVYINRDYGGRITSVERDFSEYLPDFKEVKKRNSLSAPSLS